MHQRGCFTRITNLSDLECMMIRTGFSALGTYIADTIQLRAARLRGLAYPRMGAGNFDYVRNPHVPLLVPEAAARRAGSSSRLAGPTRHPMGSQD